MPAPDTKLTIVYPEPFDHDPLHRIGQEMQRLLADMLTKPLPKDVLRQLYKLERVTLIDRVAGPRVTARLQSAFLNASVSSSPLTSMPGSGLVRTPRRHGAGAHQRQR